MGCNNASSSKAGPAIVTDLLVRERDKSISRPVGPIKKKDDPVDGIVRMAAATIGFASEAIHHRRQKRAAEIKRQAEQLPEVMVPEADRQPSLDCPAVENNDQTSPSATKKKTKNLAESFLARHPLEPTAPREQVPLPVVLTQRRPKTRARGFVRAYAPSLGAAGVDQEAFLDFIDTFNKALEPDPWLQAINLADLATMAAPIPEPFSMLLGFAIGAAAEAAIEAQSRFRSNNFLDSINAGFFAPRGLICFPATWRPRANDSKDELVTEVGFEGQAASCTTESTSGLSQNLDEAVERKVSALGANTSDNFQTRLQQQMNSHGGYLHWSQPAPLVFVPEPASTDQPESSSEQPDNHEQKEKEKKKKKNAFDRASIWFDDHVDKHSQAKWIEKNPDVPMASALPQPTFRSRYADPNHPAASGDLVAFLTGGRWQSGGAGGSIDGSTSDSDSKPQTEKAKQKAEKKREKEQKRRNKEQQRLEEKEEKKRDKKDKKMEKHAGQSGLSSLFQMDVLYLIVTNLPSETDAEEQTSPASQEPGAQVGPSEPPPYNEGDFATVA